MEPRGHSRIPLRNPVHIPGVRNQQLSTPHKGIQSCSGSASGLAAAVAGSQLHEFSTPILRFLELFGIVIFVPQVFSRDFV
jgi:hypothetical protein